MPLSTLQRNRALRVLDVTCACCWVAAILIGICWRADDRNFAKSEADAARGSNGVPSVVTSNTMVSHQDPKWERLFRDGNIDKLQLDVPEDIAFALQPGLRLIEGLPGEWSERACNMLQISVKDREFLQAYSKSLFKQIIERELAYATKISDESRGEWFKCPADEAFYDRILADLRGALSTRCPEDKIELAMSFLKRSPWFEIVDKDREIFLEPSEDGTFSLNVSEVKKDGTARLIHTHRLSATSRLTTNDLRYQHLLKLTGWVTYDIETDPVK